MVGTTLTPDLQIHSVPFATTAETLQGYTPNNLIKNSVGLGTGTVNQANLEALTSGGDAGNSLHHHDSLYVKAGSTSSNGSFNMAPGSALGLGTLDSTQQNALVGSLHSGDAGKTWYNSIDHQLYFWDGSAAQQIPSSSSLQGSTFNINPSTNKLGMIITGSGSQTLDLTQWKDHSGNILASMSSGGQLTVSNLRITGGAPGANKVLTSDGSGNASWESPAVGGGGTLTAVTGTAPISSSGGTTPVISIPKADTTHDGYLAQADFATFNNKESAIPIGSTAQYYRGDKSWRSLSSDVFALMTATSPVTVSTLAGTIGIQGLSGLGTADQILAMNHSADGVEYKTLTGTSNRISVTGAAGSLTLSTPQDIATSSSPSFTGLTLSGLSSAGVVRTNSSGVLSTSALSSSDLTTALGFAPLNKAGDTMSGNLIVSGGNVGIGTTGSPNEKLEVNGNTLVNGTLQASTLLIPNDSVTASQGAACGTNGQAVQSSNGFFVCVAGTWRKMVVANSKCDNAGGVYNATNDFCVFPGSTCPSGFTTAGWTATTSATVSGSGGCGTPTCNTGGHTFSNTAVESCCAPILIACGPINSGCNTGYATVTQIACR